VMRFVKADLTKDVPVKAEYGFCTDVMEHIPPDNVDKVLDNCLMACQHVFFQISTVDDVCGALIGHPLHLTVKPYAWWLKKFQERDCVIHWSRDVGNACMFYVTAWQTGTAVSESGVLNIEEQRAVDNVKINIKGDYKQILPQDAQDEEVVLIGGGPSLTQFEEAIRQHKAAGAKLVTFNGAYEWCLERGIGPVTQVMVDARPFNARFVERQDPNCKYLIASQCDPSVFAKLPKDRTYMWHTSAEMFREELNSQFDVWVGVPGGSTVMLRAIPLLRILGYKKFHLYGCDSCIMGDSHHAYSQPENDGQMAIPVLVKGSNRTFYCHSWMLAQAQGFIDTIRAYGNEVEIAVYGDGLLAHILETAASQDDILA
jgi:hypothetical protein